MSRRYYYLAASPGDTGYDQSGGTAVQPGQQQAGAAVVLGLRPGWGIAQPSVAPTGPQTVLDYLLRKPPGQFALPGKISSPEATKDTVLETLKAAAARKAAATPSRAEAMQQVAESSEVRKAAEIARKNAEAAYAANIDFDEKLKLYEKVKRIGNTPSDELIDAVNAAERAKLTAAAYARMSAEELERIRLREKFKQYMADRESEDLRKDYEKRRKAATTPSRARFAADPRVTAEMKYREETAAYEKYMLDKQEWTNVQYAQEHKFGKDIMLGREKYVLPKGILNRLPDVPEYLSARTRRRGELLSIQQAGFKPDYYANLYQLLKTAQRYGLSVGDAQKISNSFTFGYFAHVQEGGSLNANLPYYYGEISRYRVNTPKLERMNNSDLMDILKSTYFSRPFNTASSLNALRSLGAQTGQKL